MPRLIFVFGGLLLAGCGATVSTFPVPPTKQLPPPSQAAVRAVKADPAADLRQAVAAAGSNPAAFNKAADLALGMGTELARAKDPSATGFFVSAVELGLKGMGTSKPDSDPAKYATVNSALLQVLSLSDNPSKLPRQIDTPLGVRTLRVNDRGFDSLVPAQTVGMYGFTYRMAQPGFGVPIVGIDHPVDAASLYREDPAMKYNDNVYLPRGTFSPLTAVPRIQKSQLIVDLEDDNHNFKVPTPSGTAPLAFDLTAPLALFFNGFNDLGLGIRGLFLVGDQAELAGLYMIEPYDPDRIPVVMVHGLSSSPLIWRNLINELSYDPVIRENFQFWIVYYPSGIPTTASSYFLRERISTVQKRFDPHFKNRASRDLITLGHSMGGVITRMNAVHVGDRLWSILSDKPFDEINIDAEDRAKVKPRLFWEPIPQLSRSIYFSAPHRGATLADSSLANLGMRLIRFPATALQFQQRLIQSLASSLTSDIDITRYINSIGSLSPENPVYAAVNASPVKDDFVYHSVMGDRGRGDTPDSSDGIVGYWSSHLDGAESEIIVPTAHDSFTHPNAIAETQRILREHLGYKPISSR